MTLMEGAAYAPGVLALLATAVGYGALRQRVRGMERSIETVEALRETLGRLDELTKSVDAKIDKVSGQVGWLVSRLVGPEPRTFRRED